MLFLITLIIIAVIGTITIITTNIIGYYRYSITNLINAIANIVTTIVIVILIIYLSVAFVNNYESEDISKRFSEKYESCMYRLEHNSFGNGYIEYTLLKDITEYNKSVLKGRKWQNDKWFGAVWADIYDELDLIELPK